MYVCVYVCTVFTVATAVLKAVSLLGVEGGGEGLRTTDYSTDYGLQWLRSSLRRLLTLVWGSSKVGCYRSLCMYVCMYEIQDRQDPVKGSGWVLFPSTMAEQPIQQIVVGHLCFQECTEQ